jgi:alpha-beta hydrolase superfamily lysophospholipase
MQARTGSRSIPRVNPNRTPHVGQAAPQAAARTRSLWYAVVGAVWGAAICVAGGGCFSQTSYPMVEAELRLLPAAADSGGPDPDASPGETPSASTGASTAALAPAPRSAATRPATRTWVDAAHRILCECLPETRRNGLTTSALTNLDGGPVRVCERFGWNPEMLGSLSGNLSGLICSAQMIQNADEPVGPMAAPAPDWPGFRAVEVPVAPGTDLCGRIAYPPGRTGDYVIIVHGLFGHLGEYRYRDLAEALQRRGFGVLGLDMRGHGRTEQTRPGCPMTFGLLEPGDLRAAAEWLRRSRGARRVGLIGFSMGGFQSLLAASQDGNGLVDPIGRRPVGERPAFDAGVIAVSPLIDSLGVAAALEPPADYLSDPVRFTIQNSIRRKMAAYADEDRAARAGVWDFFEFEIGRSPVARMYPDRRSIREQALTRIDLAGADWSAGVSKMESIRVPTLVLHAANDPLTRAQSVAELAARVRNPNFGVILLPDGGHTGFPALSSAYYYSLIVNFFDPRRGPAAVPTALQTDTASATR